MSGAGAGGSRPDDDGGDAAPLEASLSSPLPDSVAVGAGTVLQVAGECDRRVDPGSLRLCLGPLQAPVDVEGMPCSDPAGRSTSSAWWTLLELPGQLSENELEVTLRARVAGRPLVASLGCLHVVEAEVGLAPPAPSVVTGGRAPLITVCMATHEPNLDHLARQLDSIRAQDWPAWVCLISDDASSPECFAGLQGLIADDARFIASRAESRLGFYRNFERALRMVPVEAAFIALSDQDDVWYPDKLSALHGALAEAPGAELAYSDMRIVDEHGTRLSDTYWILRRNRWDDVTSLLVANTVTGAASLFRREVLTDALPFPPAVAEPYHDHWLALCALVRGGLAYLDRPTYDRVRHLGSVTDDTRHARALRTMRERPDGADRAEPAAGSERRDLEAVYRHSYQQLAQFARVAELRIGERAAPGKRRALRRFAGADRSLLAPLWLGLRSLRPLIGRNETLGRERALAAALVWRRAAGRRRRRPGAVASQAS